MAKRKAGAQGLTKKRDDSIHILAFSNDQVAQGVNKRPQGN